MPSLHALLGPSSAHRYLNCPPSARLDARLKDRFGEKESPFAAEGTLAHSVAELKLRHEIGELNDFNFNAQLKAKGEITREMDNATNYYVDIIMEKLYAARQKCPDAQLFVEQKLDVSNYVPHCFGTGDAVIVSDEILEVCDLKYGRGVPVSAVENPQARLYGLGAINEFGVLYGFETVRNTIIQPRLDSVTEETLTKQELMDWGESIKPIAQMAWEGKGDFKPGEHCRFCSARAVCAARAAEAMKIFQTGLDPVGVISDADIPGILDTLDIAEDWIKDIRAYAQSQALRGQQWPGYKLVRGKKPARKWVDEEKAQEILARAGYEEEQYMEHRLKSCSEMEKSLGKTAMDALVGGLVTQGEASLVLVPESDKRVEYSPAEAALSDLFN